MPIDPEKIAAGKCYRFREGPPRRVLLIQEKKLTFVLHGGTGWLVARSYQDVDSFAKLAESEISASTLEDIPQEAGS